MSKNISSEKLGLSDPEVIKNHIQIKKHELIELQKGNQFPVEVFPHTIKNIIEATYESLGFPTDFTGCSMLYAVSVATGNTHRAELKNNWLESAVLYFSLVGSRGTAKSHPISFILRPIEERDAIKYQKYLKENNEYDAISKLTKKERLEQGYEEPQKPYFEQLLVSDFTPEALAKIHRSNIRGIGVYVDELASWFNNFNRYSKGSEEQFWLSLWSGKPIRVSRVSSEPTYIQLPFISVIGTIQPGIIHEMAKNRKENGFLDRILFVMPDSIKKEYWSEKEIENIHIENWNRVISNLLELKITFDETNNPLPEILRFSAEAKEVLYNWQRILTDESNTSDNDDLKGINAKMEMYAIRLSLCIQMMYYACNEGGKETIEVKAVEGAIKLVDYFKKAAIKVHSIINDDNPIFQLSSDRRIVYERLPETFQTKEGVQIALDNDMTERSFKRFLNNVELFNKLSHGNYQKRY